MNDHRNRFSGVIFDMDGVLCDSEPFIYEAARRMFKERRGIDVTRADFKPFVGAGENRYLGGVAEKHGVPFDLEADKARTYEIYLEIIRGRLDPLPGVREFVAECRRRGLRLAVASSADRVKVDGNLRELGIPPETFDVTVTGSDVERKKPDPQIFEAAARSLGLDPADCLVIEDSPNGVAAGVAAGSRVLGIASSFDAEKLRELGADWTAPDLAGVPPEALDAD